MKDFVVDIEHGLRCMGLSAPAHVASALARHLELVLDANERFNLTRVSATEAVSLHVLDSCSAAPMLSSAPEGSFADIGSGAGFPGIPLCLLTGRDVALVESVRKKAAFLESTVADLCLNATVHPIRAEELAGERPASYAAVTARAVSALPSLVELAAPLLSLHGLLICLKGEPTADELARGRLAAVLCGMRQSTIERVELPDSDARRNIVVYERVGRMSARLPRRPGMAQRQPLA